MSSEMKKRERTDSSITFVETGKTGTDGESIYLEIGDRTFSMAPETAERIVAALESEILRVWLRPSREA